MERGFVPSYRNEGRGAIQTVALGLPVSQRATWQTLIRAGPVVGVALILRLWPLPRMSLWYDELQSVTIAYRPFPASLLSSIAYDPHPPLYNLLLGVWMRLGQGDSIIILSSV